MIETIDWVSVDEQLPDDGFTVLVFHRDLNEPVWLGYHQDGCWYSVDGVSISGEYVTHWAEMPAGPDEVAG